MDSMYEAVGTYEAEIVDESTAPVYKMKAVAMYQKDNPGDGKKEGVWKTIAVFCGYPSSRNINICDIDIIGGCYVNDSYCSMEKKEIRVKHNILITFIQLFDCIE